MANKPEWITTEKLIAAMDEGVLPRIAGPSDDRTKEYAEIIRNGLRGKLDMPKVIREPKTGHFWVTDGTATIYAYIANKRDQVQCLVAEGTKLDAIWEAMHANAQHGMPLDSAAKRQAARNYIAHEEAFAGAKDVRLGNQQIANWIGCGISIVIAVRAAMDREKAKGTAATSNGKAKTKTASKATGSNGASAATGTIKIHSNGKTHATKGGTGGPKLRAGRPSKAKMAFREQKLGKDPTGTPVPDWLRPVAETAVEMASVMTEFTEQMDRWRKKLLALKTDPSGGGQFIEVDEIIASLVPGFEEARRAIQAAQYTHVCVLCAAAGKAQASCSCKGRGWHTRGTFEDLKMGKVDF